MGALRSIGSNPADLRSLHSSYDPRYTDPLYERQRRSMYDNTIRMFGETAHSIDGAMRLADGKYPILVQFSNRDGSCLTDIYRCNSTIIFQKRLARELGSGVVAIRRVEPAAPHTEVRRRPAFLQAL